MHVPTTCPPVRQRRPADVTHGDTRLCARKARTQRRQRSQRSKAPRVLWCGLPSSFGLNGQLEARNLGIFHRLAVVARAAHTRETATILLMAIRDAILKMVSLATNTDTNQPLVVVAILAKNKTHCLPRYLGCLERQTWPRANTIVYIRTNDNTDDTEHVLQIWIESHKWGPLGDSTRAFATPDALQCAVTPNNMRKASNNNT